VANDLGKRDGRSVRVEANFDITRGGGDGEKNEVNHAVGGKGVRSVGEWGEILLNTGGCQEHGYWGQFSKNLTTRAGFKNGRGRRRGQGGSASRTGEKGKFALALARGGRSEGPEVQKTRWSQAEKADKLHEGEFTRRASKTRKAGISLYRVRISSRPRRKNGRKI